MLNKRLKDTLKLLITSAKEVQAAIKKEIEIFNDKTLITFIQDQVIKRKDELKILKDQEDEMKKL